MNVTRPNTTKQPQNVCKCVNKSSHTVGVVLRLVKSTQLADRMHPSVHFLLRFCNQVECSLGCLDVKHKAVLKLLAFEGQTRVHLLTAVQVYNANGFFGMVALVVFKHIWIPTHPPTTEDKPALFPSLQKRQ